MQTWGREHVTTYDHYMIFLRVSGMMDIQKNHKEAAANQLFFCERVLIRSWIANRQMRFVPSMI